MKPKQKVKKEPKPRATRAGRAERAPGKANEMLSIGFESIQGRKIPFIREPHGSDYVVTTYGSHCPTDHSKGISLLVKHERRGGLSWGLAQEGRMLKAGAASRKLQGFWNHAETSWLFGAVEEVRLFPEQLANRTSPYSSGTIIYNAVLTAITTGEPHKLHLLAKCVEAVNALVKQTTKRERVSAAILDAANKLGRVPTHLEALQSYSNAGLDADEGNFIRALRDAGFGWLLHNCKKS